MRRRKLRDRLPKLKAVSNSSDRKREKRILFCKVILYKDLKLGEKKKFCQEKNLFFESPKEFRVIYYLVYRIPKYKTRWIACRKVKDLFIKQGMKELVVVIRFCSQIVFYVTKSQNRQWITYL